jgi:peptide-methionine (S)-S-oxide reductase
MKQVLLLGGGCFWCIEEGMRRLQGVERVISGYAGGDRPHPSYQHVSSGESGHIEVVQVTFDDSILSLETVVEVFCTLHDPTSRDRQGADSGSQYRSVIFCNQEQREGVEHALERIDALSLYGDPIVTEVGLDVPFYPAEEYHQDYYENNKQNGYCQVVISPKLAKLRKAHRHLLKPEYQD